MGVVVIVLVMLLMSASSELYCPLVVAAMQVFSGCDVYVKMSVAMQAVLGNFISYMWCSLLLLGCDLIWYRMWCVVYKMHWLSRVMFWCSGSLQLVDLWIV